MMCGNSGDKKKGLCPVSFGLALGITFALSMFIWSMYMMYRGLPPEMMQRGYDITWGDILKHTFWALVQGFVFGFFVALFYDLISCLCRCRCCKTACACACCGNKKPGDSCDCNCHNNGTCKCCGKSGAACNCCASDKK
jgi:hypothetical protein